MKHHAYIGLGSNLNDPVRQINTALVSLDQLPGTCLHKTSSLYTSAPIGPQDQPDFINAVALLLTQLKPLVLLDKLQAIEAQHQRVRERHWGPRTLDLDILLYDHTSIHHPRLIVPHPRMHERSFVLSPLAEINPHLGFPDGQSLSNLLSKCPTNPLIRLDI